ARDQDRLRRTTRRHRDEPERVLLRGARPAAHDSCRHRLRLRRGEDDLRPDRRQGLDQQGRDHARGLRRHDPEGDPARRAGPGSAAARLRRGPRRLARERSGSRRRPRGARARAPEATRRGRPRPAGRPRPRARPEPEQRRAPAHRRGSRLGRGPRAADDRAAGRIGSGAGRRRTRHDDAEDADRGRDEAREGRGRELMLLPKKTKFRKVQRGRRRGTSKGQTQVQFGDFGLKSLEAAWITNRQIEAARIAMTRKIKRGGKVWINVFPDKSVTAKPAETRMGSGKGSPEHWVAVVKPGRVLFELAGVPEPLAKEALRLAGTKLSVKTKVVKREA